MEMESRPESVVGTGAPHRRDWVPGEHFYDSVKWEDRRPEGPHIWRTLGYERTVWEPGLQVVEWKATEDYAFPTKAGPIIHGGMVSTIIDTAMGGACWTLLDRHEAFLTADLHVEFLRSAAPGLLRGEGWVVHKARRVVFCAGRLLDADGNVLATGRCTQVVLSGDGPAGRPHRNPPATEGSS